MVKTNHSTLRTVNNMQQLKNVIVCQDGTGPIWFLFFFDLIKASENVAELLVSTKYDSQLLPFVMLIVELH